MFRQYDKDNSGFINHADLENALKSSGIQLAPSQYLRLEQEAQLEEEQGVSLASFERIHQQAENLVARDTEIMEALKFFDDGDGGIDLKNMLHSCTVFERRLEQKDVSTILQDLKLTREDTTATPQVFLDLIQANVF